MDVHGEATFFWGVAGRGSTEARRVAVDLGLRSALLEYGDWSVPGIAGASFVRQIVWPCVALAVDVEMPGRGGPVPKARLATAIEALSCKLFIAAGREQPSEQRPGRISGTRSLPSLGWSFRDLAPPQGFVSNPRRRPATRALHEEGGLGFATGAQRLQGMTLTRLGRQLTASVLERSAARSTVRSWLEGWPDATEEPTKRTREQLGAALGPFDPTDGERQAVMAALVNDGDDGRRRRLVTLLGEHLDDPAFDVEADVLRRLRSDHAAEIRASWAFRRLLTAGQRQLRAVASVLPHAGVRRPVRAFLEDGGAAVAHRTRTAARDFLERVAERPDLRHPDAVAFATAMVDGDDAAVVVEVVRRAEQLIRLDGDVLRQGPSWTPGWLDDQDILDPESETAIVGDLPPRFGGLMGLLRDCRGART
jgi:hypothetical protein